MDEHFDDRDSMHEFIAANTAERKTRMELRRRWDRSLWRIIPLPIISYSVVGTYLWMVNTPDAWYRAAAPVMAIMIYMTLAPIIRVWWHKRTRKKIESERMPENGN